MEMRETFKKSDLKTGMIVEMKDGSKFTVMLDTAIGEDILIGVEHDYDWEPLRNYNDDLININCHYVRSYDIARVYQPFNCYTFVASDKLNASYYVNDSMLIWERKEQTDFLDDKEAMADFLTMSKSAFLFTYHAYTEEMYENTKALVEEKLGLR